MSAADQEHTLHLVASLLKKRGASAIIGGIILAPVVVGAVLAILSYNYTAVSYVRDINYAKNNVPIIAKSLVLTDDSLRSHGISIPFFSLIEK